MKHDISVGNATPSSGGRLRPREHGAYAMLAFPLLSGWLAGGLSLAGVAFAVAAVAAFLAHEPATVLLGGRGRRLSTTLHHPARRRLQVAAAVAVAGGTVFVGSAPPPAVALAAVPGALAVAVGALVWRNRVKTLVGEVSVAATFAAAHLPVARAGGAQGAALWLPAGAWFAGFVAAALAVHALKQRFKPRQGGGWLVPAAAVVGAAVTAAGGMAIIEGVPGGAALLPLGAVPLAVAMLPIHPRRMKRVGWSVVGADVVALGVWAVVL